MEHVMHFLHHHISLGIGTAFVLCLGTGDGSAVAQSVHIGDVPSCAQCSIQLERITTLRTDDPGAGIVRPPRTVARDSRGRYYLTQFNRGTVSVFAASGEFLNEVGRQGRGPSEFLNVGAVGVLGDSIFVFDGGNSRVAIAGPEGNVVRTAPMPGQVYTAAPIGTRGFALQGNLVANDLIGFPIHTWYPESGFGLSFGSEGTYRPDLPRGGIERRIATGIHQGTVWSVPRRVYRLEEWDIQTGQMKRRFLRDTGTWFPPNWSNRPYDPNTPRPPLIQALREVAPDHLLVVISVAHPKWAERLTQQSTPRGLRWSSGGTGAGSFARRIELLDTRMGRLLAVETLEQEIVGFIDNHTVFSYRLDDVGHPFVDIWKVSVFIHS